eukprot:918896_1
MNYKSVGILVLVACLMSTAGASKLRFKGMGKRISGGADLESKHNDGECDVCGECLCVESFFHKHGEEWCGFEQNTIENYITVGANHEASAHASIAALAAEGYCFKRVTYDGDFERYEMGCACPNQRFVTQTANVIGFYITCNATA